MGLFGNLGAAIGGAIGGLFGGKDGAKKGADLGRKVGDSIDHFLNGGNTGTQGGSSGSQGDGGQQGNNGGGKIQAPSGDKDHKDDDDDDDDSDSPKKRLPSNKKLLTPKEAAALRAQQPLHPDWVVGNGLLQIPMGERTGAKQLEPGEQATEAISGQPGVIMIPADAYLTAKLTPLGRSVIKAFIHEGLPGAEMKAADWLRHFARYGWDPYETADAHMIYDSTMEANSGTAQPGQLVGPFLTFPDKRTESNWWVMQVMKEGAAAFAGGGRGYGIFGGRMPPYDPLNQQTDPTLPPFNTNTPAPTGTPPPTSPFMTNTPLGPRVTPLVVMTLTSTSTPGNGSGLIDLSSLLAILNSGQYKYEPTQDNIDAKYLSGILLSKPEMAEVESGKYSDIVDAYNTLSKFLDPGQFKGPNGEPAWWYQDGKVTVDEILALIAYHEGRNSPETRQAVYARYLLYMGGDPNAQRSDISQGFTTSLDSQQHSYDLDRFLRFLSYYQPWREPGSDHIPFDTGVLPDSVTQLNRTAAQDIQGEIQRLHSTDPIVVASVFTSNGKSILSPGITLQNDVISQTANLPFQFATRSDWSAFPLVQSVIDKYIKNKDKSAIGDGEDQLYAIVQDGTQITVVLTREQAVKLAGSANNGITIPKLENK